LQCDFRYPDRIRAAPSPLYTLYEEVYNFGKILLEVLEQPYEKRNSLLSRRAEQGGQVISIDTAATAEIVTAERTPAATSDAAAAEARG
jgi:hypothetical protein